MASHLRDQRRIQALFRASASDYLLREQFVTDPAQLLSEYVSGQRLDPDAAAAANHLVYAMVSNPRLLGWLQTYASRSAEVPSGDEFAQDFARALSRDGDEQTLLAIVRAAGEGQDVFSVQSDMLRALITVLRGGRGGSVFAGTEMSSPGTEISPGHGTEISSAVFRGTEMSSPGTEISPGQAFAGTEKSSPGTEISPGPGTDMSPGRFGGIDIEVTLSALVDFAGELRSAGALSTVRFR
ncbi:MAG: hypothetical protein ACJ74O_18355 [Frankiaceae bacterium]